MRVLLLAVARLNLDAIGDYAAAGGTNDVSHLERWPAHFFSAAFGCSPGIKSVCPGKACSVGGSAPFSSRCVAKL